MLCRRASMRIEPQPRPTTAGRRPPRQAGRGRRAGARRRQLRLRARRRRRAVARSRSKDRSRHAELTGSAGQWASRSSPHGVTRSRSCSMRVGPMPGTASRSSTDERPVLRSVVGIFCAVIGPTPGQLVELLLIASEADRRPACTEASVGLAVAPPPATASTRLGTRTWIPSTSSAARLSPATFAFRLAPPARRTASAIRAPSRSR